MDLSCVLGYLSIVFSTDYMNFNGGTIFIFPPKKIIKTIYRCDNKFYLDDVLEMYENDKKYGVILISGKRYVFYLVTITGSHVEYKVLHSSDIYQPNKHNKGGSSAHRFEGIRKAVHMHFTRQISEDIVKIYMRSNHTECIVSKLIIGGPAEFKNEVRDSALFQQHMIKYLAGTITTNDIDEYSARYALSMSIEEIEILEIKKINEIIDNLLQETSDLLIFSLESCMELLQTGELKTLFVNNTHFDKTTLDSILSYQNTKTNIILTKSDRVLTFGGIIGIKYFVNQADMVDLEIN